MISVNDKKILRSLAEKQHEYANMDCNKEKMKEWYRHRRFEYGKPMVVLEIGGFRDEVYGPRLKCTTPLARNIENQLYSNFLNYELFNDDKIVLDYFPVHENIYFKPFDTAITKINANNSIGHHFVPVVKDLEADFHLLKRSTFGYRKNNGDDIHKVAQDIFGDILPVKKTMNCLRAELTQHIVHLMDMETFLISMFDCPDLIHKMMENLSDDYLAYFKWLQSENLLLSTNSFERLGQGTYCCTQELPSKANNTKDVWCFMDSQETAPISPAMYKEFIFPYYKKIAKEIGLLSYGCCEPVDGIWSECLSTLANLRNVSVSEWCNQNFMGEQLQNRKIIFHRKPSANFLSVDRFLNEDAFRPYIVSTLKAAEGCQLEITQRDILTIHSDEKKAKRYIEIINEEIENNW